jgi:hypothetical protein
MENGRKQLQVEEELMKKERKISSGAETPNTF